MRRILIASFFLLAFQASAFAAYNGIYNPDTGRRDMVGANASGDVSMVCDSASYLQSTGAGSWGCVQNVGIGTTSATSKLTVSADKAAVNLFNVVSSDASTVMIVDKNNNVGIGTSIPSSKLHIAGDIFVNGLNAISNFTSNSASYVYRNLFIGNSGNRTTTSAVANEASENIFIGQDTGTTLTTGYKNLCAGNEACDRLTTAYDNAVYGDRAGRLLLNSNAYHNSFFGNKAGGRISGGYSNTCLGYGTCGGYYDTPGYAVNTLGLVNIGAEAGYGLAESHYSVLIGYGSGYSSQGGDNLLFVGYQSGYNNTTGANNLVIGTNKSYVPIADGSNQLNIQNIIYGVNNAGTENTVSTGNIGIGLTNPIYKLDVAGTLRNTTGASFATTSGSVGVGLTNPVGKLNVHQDLAAGTVNDNAIVISNSNTTAYRYNDITFGFGNPDYDAPAGIRGVAIAPNISHTSMLQFFTSGNAQAKNIAMTINESGNIGIGLTNPAVLLEVLGDNGAITMRKKTNATGSLWLDFLDYAGTELGYFGYGGAALNFYVANLADGNMYFWNDGGTQMTIQKDTGNVGIGVTTPSTKLDVTGAISASVGSSNGKATCWSGAKLSYCSSAVGADGTCTCTA